MDKPAHGTRRRYQIDRCPCAPCKAANTAYHLAYRAKKSAGRPVLGTRTDGTEATRIVAGLLQEGFRKCQIALALGHRWPMLHFRAGRRVTVRTTVRLRVIERRLCA